MSNGKGSKIAGFALGVLASLAVIFIALAAYFLIHSYFFSPREAPQPLPPLTANKGYSFKFADAGEDPVTMAPSTQVSLTANDTEKVYDLGKYEGGCSVIEGSAWKLLAGEQSGAICYFAGGGTELGIFNENGKIVVKKGTIEEGTAESAGTRGNFTTLRALD
jgi:hypothetical protein